MNGINGTLTLHRIASVKVDYDHSAPRGYRWANVTFIASNGDRFTVSAFPVEQGSFLPIDVPQADPAEAAE